MRFYRGEITHYPPYPEHYFTDEVKAIFKDYELKVIAAILAQQPFPEFPEKAVLEYIDNTWRDTAKAVFNNWLGKIYQITHQDRRLPFMEGIDANNPLGLIFSNV